MKKRQVVVWALTLVMVLSCTWNLLISVSAEETDNSTTRVEYDYWLKDRYFLPNYSMTFDNVITCTIWDQDHPEGMKKELKMKTVQLMDDSGVVEGNSSSSFWLDKDETGDSIEYLLEACDFGKSIIRVTHEDVLDPSKTVTKDFVMMCIGDAWDVNFSTDNGFTSMFSGESKNLMLELEHKTSACHEDEDGDKYYENDLGSTDNADIEWEIKDEDGAVESTKETNKQEHYY